MFGGSVVSKVRDPKEEFEHRRFALPVGFRQSLQGTQLGVFFAMHSIRYDSVFDIPHRNVDA